MLVTGQVVPPLHTGIWIALVAVLGVLFAFPLKKRFINDEQLPFPEGYAAGVVMDSLHSEHGREGIFKAKLLAVGGVLAGAHRASSRRSVMGAIRLKWLTLPQFWDDFIYRFATPRLLGTPLRDLTIRFDSSIVMMGTGGLMGIRTAASLLITATLNYFVLAPIMIQQGVIHDCDLQGDHDLVDVGRSGDDDHVVAVVVPEQAADHRAGLRRHVRPLARSWRRRSRWPTSSCPCASSSSASRSWARRSSPPRTSSSAFTSRSGCWRSRWSSSSRLIAVNSTGLTSITPGGAIAKMTQLTFSVVARGNTATNIMTAGITSDVTLSASNLLMDIKPGYMLGAKPRQQAVGHVLGIFAGALVAVPIFYAFFHGNISIFTSEQMPMPGAQIWKSVAELLTHGFSTLHYTARIAMAIGAVLGLVIEIINQRSRGRFPLSGVALGLGFVLRFSDVLAMAIGASVFWLAARRSRRADSLTHRVFVDNQETLSAGIIAGGSIAGILAHAARDGCAEGPLAAAGAASAFFASSSSFARGPAPSCCATTLPSRNARNIGTPRTS